MNVRESILVASSACLLAIGGILGCSSSTNDSSEDNAARDVRGAPINSPVAAAPTQSVSVAVAPPSDNARQTETVAPKAELPNANAAAVATPTPALAVNEQPAEAAPAQGEEFMQVTFEKLASFTFEIPDEQPSTNKVATPSKSENQIPATVQALDQKKVALKGFMLPLKVESGLVTEMLIMRDQSMCCYGAVPKINEWVSIKMTEKGVKAIMDQPVTIFGKLRVGEIRENGYLVGIYQMDGERIAGPLDL
ncbi:MAG: DUF3299 domain-containing protein [Verrucomicrobia bacterium]|nr:DUF3299 domain-containing protein [Verrucomicrobiota bacterium]